MTQAEDKLIDAIVERIRFYLKAPGKSEADLRVIAARILVNGLRGQLHQMPVVSELAQV